MKEALEHLRLLSIFHYVVAGFIAIFALFPTIHLIVGLVVLISSFNGDSEERLVGILFVVFSSIWILLGLSVAALVVFAGRNLANQKKYTFCLVMGAVLCVFMPFGTVLGVFTIIVLVRESVKELFDYPPPVNLNPDTE